MLQKVDLGHYDHNNQQPRWSKLLCGCVIASLGTSLLVALLLTQPADSTLSASVLEKLPESGVQNPVTAVLLNFRSYDTLLEIAVLLIVAIAMLPGEQSPASSARLVIVNKGNPLPVVLEALLTWLVPITLVVAGYMLWTGAYTPGGAFQAAALVAGGGVLLHLSGRYSFIFSSGLARLLLTLGLILFVSVAALVAAETGTVLQYPLHMAGTLILVIEFAATISIATILLLLYSSLAAPEVASKIIEAAGNSAQQSGPSTEPGGDAK